MNAAERRGARAALEAARPAVDHLDHRQGTEDVAADLIEIWRAVEMALRAFVGGSALGGHALIREARARQVINYDQANTLAQFSAVHDRLESTSYHPTEGDVSAAREALRALDDALSDESSVKTPAASPEDTPSESAVVKPKEPVERTYEVEVTTRRGWSAGAILFISLVGLAMLVAVGYYLFRPRAYETALDRGVTFYRAGQRESAVGEFNKAARANPRAALPHVYLARMAREVGNFTVANQELQLALEAEPRNALALREMGSSLLAAGNYELASRFYVRAIQADSTDKVALGYLGCTMMRLNRPDVAQRFFTRAGPGPWTACTPVSTPAPR